VTSGRMRVFSFYPFSLARRLLYGALRGHSGFSGLRGRQGWGHGRMRLLLIVCAASAGVVASAVSWCGWGSVAPASESPSHTPANGVESVEVTSPNGSERWLVGSAYNITWTAAVSSALVKIEYSSNGGTTWSVFKTSTPNDGSESWTVSNIPSAMCLVRVSDAADGDPSDTSDSWFRVEPAGSWPLITTKTPGEVFVSFVGGDSAADSEIGFGYASATTPAQNRYILFQNLPHNPTPAKELSLGFMAAGSKLDFYVISLGVSAYSGNRPNETFSDINGDNGLGDTAVTVISGEAEGYLLHLDRATGGIDDDNDFLIQVKIVPTGESPPVAIVQTPAGVQSGNVVISYTLKDVQGDECTIAVHFSDDGGWTWRPATAGPGGDGTANLASSRTGQNHVFVWNSVADIGLTRQDHVLIRITPYDPEQGTAGATANFIVDNVPPPELSCSPASFAFQVMEGDPDPAEEVMNVWNAGGGEMDWRVADDAPWLTLIPVSGQSAGEKDEVAVSVATSGLSPAVYDATITVSCLELPGVTIEVPVRLTVLERVPLLSVSPEILNFSAWEGGATPPSQNIQIQNVGGNDMPWELSADRLWLTLSPESGSSIGEVDAVEVSVDLTGLDIGSYAAHITVSAPGVLGSPQRVAVLLEITAPPPLLSVSPMAITFDCMEGENRPIEQMLIRNVGTGEFSWEISDDADWLSVSPTSGSNSGEEDALEARADVSGLSPGTYTATITITATTVNSPQEVDVTLIVREMPPTISVSPTLLSFSSFEGGENPAPQQLAVKNAGRGEMDWQVSGDMVWLTLSPQEGASAGEEDTVEVSIDISGLTAGSYAAHITITSAVAANSPAIIPVLLEISEPPPRLSVSPAELVFSCPEEGDDPPAQDIEIRNVGTGEFTWDVSDDAAWLSLAPPSGNNAGETDTVEVSVSIAGLLPDTYTATITVGGTAYNSPQTVSVKLTVTEQPPAVLEVAPLNLAFSSVEGEENPPPQEITILNTGGRKMTWEIASDAAWLSALPASGSGKREADIVEVSVDISELPPGTYWGKLTVAATGAINSPQSVQVRAKVEERPPVLAVTPLSLSFVMKEGEAEPAPQSFSIRNEGGRAMEWQVSADAGWVRVTPESGTNAGSPEVVQVSVVSEGMEAGVHTASVKVEAPGAGNSPQTLSVSLTIKAGKPELRVLPDVLHFTTRRGGGNPPSKTFTVTVRFYESITWAAEENAHWLSLSPSTDTNAGEEDAVSVSVNKAELDLGTYECEIVVRDVLRPTCTASVQVILRVEPIRVPEDYATIQEAIDEAGVRDIILVREGAYPEKIRMKSYIEVLGEGADTTVIDCQGKGTPVAFEDVDWARLEGFTITGGTGECFGRSAAVGGGVYILGSSPSISRCRVVNNSAVWGGGICIDADSAPALDDCEICGNSAIGGGGLFFYEESSATIRTTKISGNSAEWYGGGLCLASLSSATIGSCEISGNQASYDGGGIHAASRSSVDMVSCTVVANSSPEGGAMYTEGLSVAKGANTIIWGNNSPMVLQGGGVFRHCDVEDSDLAGKNGNIYSEPLFVGAEDADYHLLPCSPCIDRGSNEAAGLPATDLDGEARIMEGLLGALTDIGADEVNPGVPVVLAEEVLAGDRGLVYLSYKLCRVLSLPCSVLVEYSADGGKEWHRATRAPEGEATSELSSSPSGEVHTFVWDSVADEGGVQVANVLLRVTPEGAEKGRSLVAQPFSLDNAEVDSDNDRLPDAWEQAIVDANLYDGIASASDVSGEDDFDGDGSYNRSEYLSGTSAVDGQSYLRLVCISGGGGEAIVSWPSVKERMYRLLYCDALEDGWRVLRETMAGTGSWIEFEDPTAKQSLLRFYRIEAE